MRVFPRVRQALRQREAEVEAVLARRQRGGSALLHWQTRAIVRRGRHSARLGAAYTSDSQERTAQREARCNGTRREAGERGQNTAS